MTKGVTGIAMIAALIGVPALATAMGANAPPPALAYGWTGFYLGGNIGYGHGVPRTGLAGTGSEIATAGGFSFPATFGFADSDTVRLNGLIGGGELGFNYKLDPQWVVGFEADIQSSGHSGNGSFAESFATPVCTTASPGGMCLAHAGQLTGTALADYRAKIDWFGTVRGRLGLLPSDRLLTYITGGLAYGRVEVLGSTNVTAQVLGPRSTSAAFSEAETRIGFSVGGGIEGSVPHWPQSSNWTWKLEYLYLNLGSLDAGTSYATAPLLRNVFSAVVGTIATRTHFIDNIVRVGLNYKFTN